MRDVVRSSFRRESQCVPLTSQPTRAFFQRLCADFRFRQRPSPEHCAATDPPGQLQVLSREACALGDPSGATDFARGTDHSPQRLNQGQSLGTMPAIMPSLQAMLSRHSGNDPTVLEGDCVPVWCKSSRRSTVMGLLHSVPACIEDATIPAETTGHPQLRPHQWRWHSPQKHGSCSSPGSRDVRGFKYEQREGLPVQIHPLPWLLLDARSAACCH